MSTSVNQHPAPEPRLLRRHAPQLASLGAIAAVAAFMLRISWNRWADVLVDFGREVYVPWRISQGEVFYRDIVHLFGPFSSYLNALWFTLFGAHVRVLTGANLALAALLGVMIYRFFAPLCGRLGTTILVMLYLAGFALARLGISGGGNFIAPYSHEATHGTLLCVAMLCALRAGLERPSPRWAAAAGAAWGATFLTKPDLFTAASGAALLYWAATLPLAAAGERRARLAALGAFLAAAPAIPAAFLLYFLTAMPPARALQAVAGAWMPLLRARLADMHFYRACMGLDFPAYRMAWAVSSTVTAAGLAALLFALEARLAAGRRRPHPAFCWVAGVACFAATLWFLHPLEHQYYLAHGLPGASLIACLAGLAAAWRHRFVPAARARHLAFAVFAGYAFLATLKVLFNATFSGAGFYTVLPATLTAGAVIVGIIPRAMRRRGMGGEVFRAAAAGLLLALVACFMWVSVNGYGALNYPLRAEGDTLLAHGPRENPIGLTLAQGLDEVRRSVPPEATLLALPEGALINFLARRVNPTPYNVFMPPEVMVFGEHTMLAAIQAHPPDFILLVHRNTPGEYRLPMFGETPDYGGTIMAWVRTH
jgi:hypothetical protein